MVIKISNWSEFIEIWQYSNCKIIIVNHGFTSYTGNTGPGVTTSHSNNTPTTSLN